MQRIKAKLAKWKSSFPLVFKRIEDGVVLNPQAALTLSVQAT